MKEQLVFVLRWWQSEAVMNTAESNAEELNLLLAQGWDFIGLFPDAEPTKLEGAMVLTLTRDGN